MRILFVAPYVPSRVRARSYEFVRALTGLGHRVHVVALRPPEDRWADDAPVREACERMDVFPLSRVRTLANAGLALAGPGPLQEAYSRHPAARAHVARLAASRLYDIAHVEHLRGATLLRGVAGLPVVFDAVDSISYLFEQAARLAVRRLQRVLARLELARTARFERQAPHRVARTVVTSPVDRDAIIRLAGPDAAHRVAVVPSIVDGSYFTPGRSAAGQATVLFTGKMSYHANEAAAQHLVLRVMPEVWRSRPDARVIVAGKDPSPRILALADDPRVQVTGYVADLRPLFARATVAVSPLLYGAGLQFKILEAMASGVPVVTSLKACASLTARPEHELLAGETPEEIASQALRVLRDRKLAGRLGEAGREYVVREHNATVIGRRLTEIYGAAREDSVPRPVRRASR